MPVVWNPWHGCKRCSEGCRNCYVYDRDASYGRDASTIQKTNNYDLPVQKNKSGQYKIEDGTSVYICMTSDFLLPEADAWRDLVWEMIANRPNVNFAFFTKRIERFFECVPQNWGVGYDNVTVICSVEDQYACDQRLPVLNRIPAKKRMIACAPLLEKISISDYLNDVSLVSVCGENGKNARACNFDWVIDIREQCIACGVPFHYSKTGTYMVFKGKKYFIPFEKQKEQATKANIDYLFSSH